MRTDERISGSRIAEITHGRYEGPTGDLYALGSIVIDSRKVFPGAVYVPVVGERFDGHTFIPDARKAGASLVLSSLPLGNEAPFVLVEDTLHALQLLAGYHRSRQSALVIGVTGSAGKTTTKEMIACVLEQGGTTLRTEGNLNNQTGVPQMVFRLHPGHEAAVFEMGMNHFGEIANLAAMVRPEVGVITNIGTAHIEYLGSREGILEAKSEMLPYVKPGGTVFVNGDDDLLRRLTYPGLNIVTFGFTDGCDVRAENMRGGGLKGSTFTIRSHGNAFEVYVPFPGRYLVCSALVAAGCGLYAGLRPEQIAAGIAAYEPAGSRMKIIHGKRGTIIDDTYNANLPAVLAALEVLQGTDGPRVAILGEMRELGEAAATHHRKALQSTLAAGARLVMTTGDSFQEVSLDAAAAGAPVRWYKTQEALINDLPRLMLEGDTILVKGSRGMHMEDTVERLREILA